MSLLKITRSFLLAFMLLTSLTSNGQELSKYLSELNTFFSNYVTDGKIHYDKIQKNKTDLDQLLEQAKNIRVSATNELDYKAFWINTYNILVIRGIIDNYPVNSPLSVNGFFDNIRYEAGGTKTTLNNIENNLLRGTINDARYHFVLVCAGLGCPPIISEAYVPNKLEEQLNRQTQLALNDANFTRINNKKKQVFISEIFKWYKEDFVTKKQSYIDFINSYRTEKIPTDFKVKFYTYNWNLNKI